MSIQKKIEWSGDETWKRRSKSNRLKTADAFEEFFDENKQFKRIPDESVVVCTNDYEIDPDDDEVWLVQIPKCLKPSKLEHVAVPASKGQMKLEGSKKYECVVEKCKTSNPMALFLKSEKKLVKVVPKRKMLVRLRVESPEPIDIPIDVREVIPQPENLKVRHPLFGNDYEECVTLPAKVQRKLDDAKIPRAKVVSIKQEVRIKEEQQLNGITIGKRKSIKTEVVSPEKSKRIKVKDEPDDMSWMDEIM